MKKSVIILLALFAFFCGGAYAVDLDIFNFGKDAPIELSADSIEYLAREDAYMIRGSAVLASGGSALTADEVVVEMKSGKARAKGNVLLTIIDGSLSADELELDLNTNQGLIVHGKIFVQSENFYITGDSIERFDENNYRVKNATFTTCDGDAPAWEFSAAYVDMEIDGYAYAKNALFYIKGIPAFYLPATVFPIKKTRQSGFLSPEIGYTSDDGAELMLPYYYVISDSMDATVALDFRSKRGAGADTEYRYVLSESSRGEMNWHILNEFDSGDDRWKFSYNHQEFFSPTLFLKADLTNVGDTNYFFDFGEEADELYKEKIESNITLTKNYRNAAIQVEYSRDEDLKYDDEAGDLSTTNQQFPKITGTLYKSRIKNSPLYYSGVVSFNNYVQSSAYEFSYLKLEPQLSADFVLGRYAVLSPAITGVKARFWLHDDVAGDDNYDTYIINAKIFSQVMRVFSAGETYKIKHLVVPQIIYEYIPKQVVYEDFYALADIKNETNTISLKLTNRFNTRRDKDGKITYREPFRLEITQGFDIFEAKRELSDTISDDKREPLKPLYVDADADVTDNFTLNAELYYDHYYTDKLQRYNASMNLKDNRDDSISLSYTYLKYSNKYMQSDVNINLSHGLSFNNTIRYDYLDDTFLEATYGLNLAMQCWGVSLKFTEDTYDKKVLLYFSLKGVGETSELGVYTK